MGSGQGSNFKCPFRVEESKEEHEDLLKFPSDKHTNVVYENNEESKLQRKSAYRFSNSSESSDSEENKNFGEGNEQGNGQKEESDGELSIEQINEKLNEIDANFQSVSNPIEINTINKNNQPNNITLPESIELISGLKKIINRKKRHVEEGKNLVNASSTSQIQLIPPNQPGLLDRQIQLNKIEELEKKINELKSNLMIMKMKKTPQHPKNSNSNLMKPKTKNNFNFNNINLAYQSKSPGKKEKHKIKDQIKELEFMLNEKYVCPISSTTFEDPVIASDGHTYERYAIMQWLEKSDVSPMTDQKLESKNLTTNYFVKEQIEDIKTNIRILKEKIGITPT